MKQRIITGIVAIAILVPVLIFADTVILPITFSLCIAAAVWEMLGCVGLRKSILISVPFYAFSVFPFVIRYAEEKMIGKIAVSALLLTVLYLYGILIFCHGKYSLQDLSTFFSAMVYVLFGFCAILYLHDYAKGGEYVYLMCFLGAWITDTFAYFSGVFFGKHKLIPEVSPKKTVEGSIGGMLFCVIGLTAYGLIVEAIDPSVRANIGIFILAGLLCSVVSQIGDLSMSVIKRNYGIKDYGFLFPGHGGVLDRFDSVLAVSIVLTVINFFLPMLEV